MGLFLQCLNETFSHFHYLLLVCATVAGGGYYYAHQLLIIEVLNWISKLFFHLHHRHHHLHSLPLRCHIPSTIERKINNWEVKCGR